MADFSGLIPLGKSNTGAAVVFSGGNDSLHYLQDQDKLRATIAERQAKAAARVQAAAAKDFASRMKLSTKGGVHFIPDLQGDAQATHDGMMAVALDKSLSQQEKAAKIEVLRNQYDQKAQASETIDKHLQQLGTQLTDKRVDQQRALEALHQTLFDAQGQRVNPLHYDTQLADAAINSPEVFNKQAVWSQFAKDVVQKDAAAYEQAARPGGTGLKTYWEGSQGIERDPTTHQPVVDPTTGDPVLRITQGTVRAAKNDPFAGRLLDHIREQRQQLENSAVQKMQNNQPLTDAERQHVELRQAGALPTFEQDLADQLVPYAYSRTKQQETFRPAPRPHVGRAAAGPKFTLTGGSDYAPEVIGGTGAGGTHGMTALAASEPLKRVKADGTTQDLEAEGLHRQYIVLKNGQPANLISNNTASQRLRYIKPQLYLTSSTGNVVSPTNPALLQAYQRGDRQPLLEWAQRERERDPKLKMAWHVLAAPAQHSKLTAGNDADAIYERLRAAGSDKSDDVLRATARKMAEQESASFLIPYRGPDKNAIDAATNDMLRDAKRKQRMQQELDYFNEHTKPRSPEARTTVAKKALGIDFGTAPKAKPTSTPPAPPVAPIKRAGTKKTGISF